MHATLVLKLGRLSTTLHVAYVHVVMSFSVFVVIVQSK